MLNEVIHLNNFDTIIRYISTGLIKWEYSHEKNKTYYPMPEVLQKGINMLAAACIEMDKEYPNNQKEAIEFFSRPIASWGILEENNSKFTNYDVLIECGQLTDICYEYAMANNDIEDELSQKEILKVMEICKIDDDQEGYVNFRRKIIKDNILAKDKVISWSNNSFNSTAAQFYKDFFEDIPPYAVKDGDVYRCKYCGWTIEWDKHNNPRCQNNFCRKYTNNFRNIEKLIEKPGRLWRLKRGCMRYIAKPGKYELELESKLLKLGLKVEMWPEFDKYDLKIIFEDGEIWAIDVKDYSSPEVLVDSLGAFPEKPYYDKAFYIVPQYRHQFNPGFERVFNDRYKYKKENLELLMERNFLKRVKDKLKEEQ